MLLLVEDEPGIAEGLQYVLSVDGIASQVASNGAEALELLTARQFDAVLTDISMPVMDGLELLARVRCQQMDVPFVFLTGFGDREMLTEALRLGATDFLEKPFSRPVLVNVLSKAIKLGRALRACDADLRIENKMELWQSRRALMLMGRHSKLEQQLQEQQLG